MRRLARFVAIIALVAAGAELTSEERSLAPLVPWKVLQPGEVVTAPLVLFWIPATPETLRRSAMLTSDSLTHFSSRCVAMRVVRFDDRARLASLDAGMELPVAILTDGKGAVIGKVNAHDGRLNVYEVEELVRQVLGTRETAAEELLRDARRLHEEGDDDEAAALYREVSAARCVCPRQARAAQKALRRLEH